MSVTTQQITVTDLFGIEGCHEYVHELADLTPVPARTDMVLAEESLRDTLSAYLPYGWDINSHDEIVRENGDADPLNVPNIRTSGVFAAIQFFDLADYVID